MDATEKTDPPFIFDHLNSVGMNPSEKTDPFSFFLIIEAKVVRLLCSLKRKKKEEKKAHTYDLLLYSEITQVRSIEKVSF
jgi:hypothetical protein